MSVLNNSRGDTARDASRGESRGAFRTPGPRKNFSSWANRHRKWLFAAPAMIFVGVLIVFPLAWTIYLSLTDSQGSVRAASEFVGLENYLTVLSDVERFWPAVGRTLTFTGVALVCEVVLGMGIALLLWRPFRGEKWVRVAILLPLVATPVAVGMMWRLIFDPNIGFVNQLLGMIGIPPQPWLSGQDTALGTTIFMDIWQWTPMVVLILLAGLTSLSEEPDEAARMDGANAFQRFFFITLPLMMPTVIVAILLRGIDALKTFDILYATKGKGGGSFHEVETLNVYAYGLSFDYNQYGLSSAVLILFFMIIIITMWLLTMRKKAVSK
ncbi:sugar ABC transporter permease [Arthrobacter sp. UYEF3]|uniref:carbohydrate ABC transporter permease n=1 Tax=Arthrobacter sp. UYEF3 TaxID=1756365 RepID=UPI003395C482